MVDGKFQSLQEPQLDQMHAYWKMDDAQMKQIDMINFTKNMALVGALLMFLLLPHPWPMSLGIG
jgi:hypothetical protein